MNLLWGWVGSYKRLCTPATQLLLCCLWSTSDSECVSCFVISSIPVRTVLDKFWQNLLLVHFYMCWREVEDFFVSLNKLISGSTKQKILLHLIDRFLRKLMELLGTEKIQKQNAKVKVIAQTGDAMRCKYYRYVYQPRAARSSLLTIQTFCIHEMVSSHTNSYQC